MPSVTVVTVSDDVVAEHATAFFQQQQLKHLRAHHDPDGQLMRELRARAVPMTFLIDRQGRVAAVVKGSVDWNATSTRALLRSI